MSTDTATIMCERMSEKNGIRKIVAPIDDTKRQQVERHTKKSQNGKQIFVNTHLHTAAIEGWMH